MYKSCGGKAKIELWLICTEHVVQFQTMKCVWYVQNIGCRGKQKTLSDMYRIFGREVYSVLCLICPNHGVDWQMWLTCREIWVGWQRENFSDISWTWCEEAKWNFSDMYSLWGREANSEMCLINTYYRVENKKINCACYIKNKGWKCKQLTVTRMYITRV